jgi:hypothetical protein
MDVFNAPNFCTERVVFVFEVRFRTRMATGFGDACPEYLLISNYFFRVSMEILMNRKGVGAFRNNFKLLPYY